MKRLLNDWLAAYMEYTEHSEAPEKFHFWTGVSTIAGALRRKVSIDMGYFQWTPNFFIVFVAPPGIVAKSTTASIGMDILGELEYIQFGPATGTWQGLIKKMTGMCEEVLMPDGSYMPMTCVTIVASELGSFLNPRDREQTDILVDLWDGKSGAWKKLTKSDDEEIVQNPWINMIACTTPAWVAENLSDYFHGGGMASRTIFVYAEKKRKLVAYPKKEMASDASRKKKILVHDLEVIASLIGQYELNPEAEAWGEAWYEKHHNSEHEHIQGDRFQGYLARKQTHIHKLAMILAASQRNELVITQKDLERADHEITKLEKDMPQVFGQMNQEKEMVIAKDILAAIQTHKTIPQKILYKDFMRVVTWDTFEKIMKSLSQSGSIDYMQDGNSIIVRAKG